MPKTPHPTVERPAAPGWPWLTLGLLLLGALLRLLWLGRTWLQIDEITVLEFGALPRTPAMIVAEIFRAHFTGYTGQHMPFQYVWANLALRLYRALGVTPAEYGMRLPFALLGIASLPLFGWMAARYYNRAVGLWMMALGAISFFHVYQSRDATSYAPLLFCIALHLCGVTGMLRARERGRPLVWGNMALGLLGALGAFFSHMSAWLLLGSEGLVLGVAWLSAALRPTAGASRALWARTRHLLLPMLLLLAATLPFLGLVFGGAATFNRSTQDAQATPITAPLLLYQLACFGWGRGAGRLVAFAAAALLGAGWALRRPDWRARAAAHLGLLALPTLLFFHFLQRDFFPRYLAASFLPLLLLAALGLAALTEAAAGRGARARAAVAIALGLLLLLWHLGPYQVLFRMRNKVMPMAQVHDWVLQHTTPGGLYIWRNGYHMREVPGAYPVSDRQPAFALFPNAGIPAEILDWQSRNARSFLERFPLAVHILSEGDEREPRWEWLRDAFTVREPIADDSIHRLWGWGFSPHGHLLTNSVVFYGCSNPLATVQDRLRRENRVGAWPVGAGWRYLQARDGQLFAAAGRAAELQVFNPGPQAVTGRLALAGLAQEAGNLTAAQPAADGQAPVRRYAAFVARDERAELGPFTFPPGLSTLELSPFPVDRATLLIYSFTFAPLPPGTAVPETPGQDGAHGP